MARKETVITLTDGDEQKRFKIRQMPATKAERWIFKMILLLGGKANVQHLEDLSGLLEAVSNQPYEKVQELLDDLLSCVSRVHDGNIESQLTPENVDGFVEEMGTLMKLRVEAFKANNFFPKAGLGESTASPTQAMIKRMTQ